MFKIDCNVRSHIQFKPLAAEPSQMQTKGKTQLTLSQYILYTASSGRPAFTVGIYESWDESDLTYRGH